jgi:hypothetical protein
MVVLPGAVAVAVWVWVWVTVCVAVLVAVDVRVSVAVSVAVLVTVICAFNLLCKDRGESPWSWGASFDAQPAANASPESKTSSRLPFMRPPSC